MLIIRGIEDFPILHNAVVTVGAFDGVHVGHLYLLEEVKAQAARINGTSVVITFDPHPQQVLHPDHNFLLLHNIEEKITFIEKAGIDCLLIIPFTLQFAQLSAEQFIRDIVAKTGAKAMVMGADHTFGKNRQGNRGSMCQLGQKMDIQMIQVEEISIGDQTVSSTAIRNFLQNGEKAKAEMMLGKKLK